MEYIRTTKIIKTGNSLCAVIPKEILVALNINRGDQIVFGVYDNNSLIIRKIQPSEIEIINPKNI